MARLIVRKLWVIFAFFLFCKLIRGTLGIKVATASDVMRNCADHKSERVYRWAHPNPGMVSRCLSFAADDTIVLSECFPFLFYLLFFLIKLGFSFFQPVSLNIVFLAISCSFIL